MAASSLRHGLRGILGTCSVGRGAKGFLPLARQQPLLGALRFFSERKTGTVKMWNDEKGFGFISPAGGGEDVFVHRSALGEGVALSPGLSVNFEALWDDRKRKDRAGDVQLEPGSEGQQAPSLASRGGGRRVASSYNIVGAFEKWSIHKTAMAADGDSGPVRHKLTVRKDAPKGSGDSKREEFQIVGDASWDLRLYPAGGDKEEVVVLQPGGAGSKAADLRGKGHGRNWAVEGQPGDSFYILYDKESQMVSCQQTE
eukprot:TRINITY_DN94050_c0_g1_i1.p1 TRINITY_DN94050_c0_g1~~TRINITY_DN94050_c0_g1_i1.p1  ORF type:complete len:256 (-),score=70.57 TRINITY_DN94050_c0_g1_i1:41-808(-)